MMEERPVLYCLPPLGAGATLFRPWQVELPGVEVVPLCPPGRESRLGEPAHTGFGDLVDDLAGDIRPGRPCLMFGHSLGALVAFEIVRRLRRDGRELPGLLILSGCADPIHAVDVPLPAPDAPDDAYVEMLRQLGGTPPELIAHRGFLEMMVPVLRADVAVHRSYRCREEAPLPVPLLVVGGDADPWVPTGLLGGWAAQSSAGTEITVLAGDHFSYLDTPEFFAPLRKSTTELTKSMRKSMTA